MIVYLDILFFINLIMNYIVLIVTSSFGSIYTKRYKIFLGSLFGAIYSVYIFLSNTQIFGNLIFKVLAAVIIVFIAFGKKNLAKTTILFFVVSFAFAGGIIGIFYLSKNPSYMMINGVPYIDISINVLISTYILCYIGLCVLYRGLGKNKITHDNITEINIKIGQNKIRVSAFKDSGNVLFDHITKKPVIIVEGDSLVGIIPKELLFIIKEDPIDALHFASIIENDIKLRIINYKAVGLKSSMMLILPVDEILDKNGKKVDAVIGISNEKINLAGCTAIMGV